MGLFNLYGLQITINLKRTKYRNPKLLLPSKGVQGVHMSRWLKHE